MSRFVKDVVGLVALIGAYELMSGKPFTLSPTSSEYWAKQEVSVPAENYLAGLGIGVVGAGLLLHGRVRYVPIRERKNE